jgi:hypothetical protein
MSIMLHGIRFKHILQDNRIHTFSNFKYRYNLNISCVLATQSILYPIAEYEIICSVSNDNGQLSEGSMEASVPVGSVLLIVVHLADEILILKTNISF